MRFIGKGRKVSLSSEMVRGCFEKIQVDGVGEMIGIESRKGAFDFACIQVVAIDFAFCAVTRMEIIVCFF